MDHQDGNQSYTPYAPPTADIGIEPGVGDASFIPGGRPVPAGNALLWIANAWGLFKQQPVLWVGFAVIYFLLSFALQLIPLVGGLALLFVLVLIIAGAIHACDVLRREGTFALGDLFVGFQRKTAPLLIVGLTYLGFAFAVGIIAAVFLVSAIASGSFGVLAVIAVLVIAVCSIAYMMALWFAPALIMMHDIAPIEALKMSFAACRKNLMLGVVFFPVMIVLTIISAIPLFLGLLVTIPLWFICYYTSYQDIFLNKEN